MRSSESDLAFIRDPRLATHVANALPMWLWLADGSEIVFANAAGAAIFGADTLATLDHRRFNSDIAGQQIAQLAGTLPHGAAPRLERLRGFGAAFGRRLTCACAQLTFGNQSFILVTATEPAGPNLSFTERVRRMFADRPDAIAVYATDGALMVATPAAQKIIGDATSLEALGASSLAADVAREGRGRADISHARMSVERIGSGPTTILLALIETVQPPQDVDIGRIAQAMARAAVTPPPPQVIAPVVASARPTAEIAERRYPLRFVWQMDEAGRFSLGSDEFSEVIGTKITTALGRLWTDIAAELNLDPHGEVARAIASRDTWSGIQIDWPVEGSDRRLTAELSGLPIYDRDRNFGGYRGFGVCRDSTQLAMLAAARREAAAGAANSPPQAPSTHHEISTANVLPFRAATDNKPAPLSPIEHTAFRELAKELTDRLRGDESAPAAANDTPQPEQIIASPIVPDALPAETFVPPAEPAAAETSLHSAAPDMTAPPPLMPPAPSIQPQAEPEIAASQDTPILDRLPVGVLIYHLDELHFANRAFLEWTGYGNLETFAEAGGLDNLLLDRIPTDGDESPRTLSLATASGEQLPLEGRLFTVPWSGTTAHALILVNAADTAASEATKAADAAQAIEAAKAIEAVKATEAALQATNAQNAELEAILDTATDGVLVLSGDGNVLSANRSAEALFGYDQSALTSRNLVELFAPESQQVARSYLEGLSRNAVTSLLDNGCEIIGRVRQGGLIPLFMTMGRVSEQEQKFCAVFRDLTQWKKAEEELVNAKRQAEKASSAKSEFLAKISHEIRTPLNAIIGFSEVMMDERFGPVGNERYREYLKDIHSSGGHVVSLLNDLLDLSKIEAGKLDLAFAGLDLNELTQQCVALMQPQANRERIIIRTSLLPSLPHVVADARSVRQIVLNLLSNSIKFTGAGGQVIVSTALTDHGEVALRVRDTGIGMSEKEIQIALEPFRQLATSARPGANGTGLGLPLTKALAEANRAHFKIRSAVNDGTLVEVAFPPERAAAE